ncbi:putative secreted protein [Streptomyces davaonensis JCM 4913]|uniref:Putative secreted protein n=1 Tax=Streptomyces davaonensis (strain DSM 101723 / JCM 4913 / KCC S-0913 / 768) TaxID=1214101 RepID=K4RBV1_STRDJ|nr:putative secreted protein [Streptomyces davaonensis JCM 4913]
MTQLHSKRLPWAGGTMAAVVVPIAALGGPQEHMGPSHPTH